MIIRTAVAKCDAPLIGDVACRREASIDAYDTQPWNTLRSMGWSLVTTDEGIETYCPEHPRD